jgi:hypothetical protein
MGVEKRSNAYHDDKLCCASCCSCSLSSVFLAKLQSETTVEPIAQQQQIEKRLSPLRSSPNDLMVRAEMSTTRAYERAQFIRPQAVCRFMAKATAYYRRRRFILVPKFRHFSNNKNINK